jgi:hypothetical protein
MGLARPGTHISFSYLFKDFSNLFKFKMVKGGLLVLENFQNKYGHVYKCIRNNFPIWCFSKFRMEFELKIRELI